MKWFKHYTDALDDPFISDLMDEFSHLGYAVFFGLIEIISRENKNNITGKLVVSPDYLRRKLRTSQAKVRQVLDFCQTNARLSVNYSPRKWEIRFPKIAEIKDNYTKDLQGACKKLSIDIEKEVYKEDKEKTKTNMHAPENFSESQKPEPEPKAPVREEHLIGPLDKIATLEEFKKIYPRINGKFLDEQEVLRRLCGWQPEDIPNILLAAKHYAASQRVQEGIGIRDPKNFIGLPHLPNPLWREWLEPEASPAQKQTPAERLLDEARAARLARERQSGH